MKNFFFLLLMMLTWVGLSGQNNMLNFDGTNDQVNAGNVTELSNQSKVTIEMWVNVFQATTWGTFFTKRVSDSDRIQFQEGPSATNGKIDIFMMVGNSSYGFGWLTEALLPNQWYHLAMVFDGTQSPNQNRLKLYINGLSRNLNFSGTVSATTPDNAAPVLIGDEIATTHTPFKGDIDEVRVWTTARTQAQIQENMNIEISPTEPGLLMYYRFNQGIPGGNNTGVNVATDLTSNGKNGNLSGFSLTGSTSNWVTRPFEAPSTGAKNVITNFVPNPGYKLKWTNGSGTARAVFVREGNSGSASPVDLTVYNPDPFFGDGDQIGTSGWYCVYTGSSDNVIVTGLTENAVYRVMVCEYYGGNGTITYRNSIETNNPVNFTACFGQYSISGYARYDNNPKTPLNGLKVVLWKESAAVDSIQTSPLGYYSFNNVTNGTFTLRVKSASPTGTWQTWGGVNNTDYLLISKHIEGSMLLPVNPPVVQIAASVKIPHPLINADDAEAIRKTAKFGWGYFDIPKWVFSGENQANRIDTVEIACASVTRDIKGLCAGDVNGSYMPVNGNKMAMPELTLSSEGSMPVTKELCFPVRAGQHMELGAISLMLDYNPSLIEITGVEMPGNAGVEPWFTTAADELHGTNGILNIGWMSMNSINVNTGQTVLIIHARLVNDPSDIRLHASGIRFTLDENPLSELADGNGNVIQNAKLSISDAGSGILLPGQGNLSVYPNPASEILNLEYVMAEDGEFRAEVCNMQGLVVAETFNLKAEKGWNKTVVGVNELPDGPYILRIKYNGRMEVRKVMVAR